MDSPYFMIAGDLDIPAEITRLNLITGLSRYDFATIAIDEEDEQTLLLRRVELEELATFEGVLFQADSGDEANTVILRQVSMVYWPFEDDEEGDDVESGDDEEEAAKSTERSFTVVNSEWWDEFTRKHRRG
jgi:hypothetical protein